MPDSQHKRKLAEREIVSVARRMGFRAELVWDNIQDPMLPKRVSGVLINKSMYPAKTLGRGLGWAYKALRHKRGLFVRADGHEWLAILPANEYLGLLCNVLGWDEEAHEEYKRRGIDLNNAENAGLDGPPGSEDASE